MRVDRADQFLDRAFEPQRDAASATSSVAREPIMCTPSISSYFFSAHDLHKAFGLAAIFARPSTPNGNVPTRTSKPRSRLLLSVNPMLPISGSQYVQPGTWS
jgi:hypothetical protein